MGYSIPPGTPLTQESLQEAMRAVHTTVWRPPRWVVSPREHLTLSFQLTVLSDERIRGRAYVDFKLRQARARAELVLALRRMQLSSIPDSTTFFEEH